MVNKKVKSWLDFGPIILFFLLFKFQGIYVATVALMVTTLLSTVYLYWAEKKIPWMQLITLIAVVVFGGLTLFFQSETFIKVKLTIVNALFASILLGGFAAKKGLLKYLLGGSMIMSDEAWRSFSLRWGIFFLLLAGLNEIIWRHFSTDVWVNYKVFGILFLTFVFMMTQYPFLKKHVQDESY